MDPNTTIRLAGQNDLSNLAVLFDLYRQFYECPADLDAAENWLQQNMEDRRSVIFTADTGSELLGLLSSTRHCALSISQSTSYSMTFMC